jgi:hypothetical protein
MNGGSFSRGSSSFITDIRSAAAERPVDGVDVARLELELVAESSRTFSGQRSSTSSRMAAPKRRRRRLSVHAAQEVAGLVLADLDVGVARDAERRRAEDLHSRKEPVEVRLDELLEEHELLRLAGAARHRHEAGERRRHLDARERGALLLLVAELDRERQRQVRDERERMRRVERERREDGEHDALEVGRELLAALRLDVVPFEDPRAGVGELRPQVVAQRAHARSVSRRTISRTIRSCSAGESPSALRSATDASICSCRPETRIMKNSSRFEWKMARNFIRSSSGHDGSIASSSTRRLNASHEISRLK